MALARRRLLIFWFGAQGVDRSALQAHFVITITSRGNDTF